MKLVRTDYFKEDYQRPPKVIQEKFDKKIVLFMSNIRHPSLRVKKMKGRQTRWEASIDMFYLFAGLCFRTGKGGRFIFMS